MKIETVNKMNWEAFENHCLMVWCRTEKQANEFLKECEKRGYTWSDFSNSKPTSHNEYEYNRDGTVYLYDNSKYSNGLVYGNILDCYEKYYCFDYETEVK